MSSLIPTPKVCVAAGASSCVTAPHDVLGLSCPLHLGPEVTRATSCAVPRLLDLPFTSTQIRGHLVWSKAGGKEPTIPAVPCKQQNKDLQDHNPSYLQPHMPNNYSSLLVPL